MAVKINNGSRGTGAVTANRQWRAKTTPSRCFGCVLAAVIDQRKRPTRVG